MERASPVIPDGQDHFAQKSALKEDMAYNA